MQFSDLNPAFNYAIDSVMDPTRGVADMSDTTLGQFLSRPLKVASYAWAPGVALHKKMNPWTAFFENPRNINRISNFTLLKCKLCVKIVINGNPFYFGRAIASYHPLPTCDEIHISRAAGPAQQDIIGLSQHPHIYLNPTECQGGSLELPFFHPQNALNIPSSQWAEMGDITLQSMSPLKHANGATDALVINVFAWAEDVDLSIPTATNPDSITAQMARDEYGHGAVERTADTVAEVAGVLSFVPGIAPFAMATTMAAGLVGQVAHAFGMSRPTILDDTKPFRPNVMGNMATVNMPDSCTKLTLDAKQETTVDSRVAGLGGADEMAFKSIVTRESYYTQFPWAVSSGLDERLFSTYVEPTIYDTHSPSGNQIANGYNKEYHLLPCGFCALPFKYWTGSMDFRFQLVSSNYHRGRLRIVWDPHDGTGTEYNTMYTQIIDIADSRDFTITVGWGQTRSFMKSTHPMSTVKGPSFAIGNGVLGDITRGNGVLSVFVVNDLTVPNSDPTIDNDISINVFAKMGEDFKFAEPDMSGISPVTYFRTPWSGANPDNHQGHYQIDGPPGYSAYQSHREEADTDASEEQESAPISTEVDSSFATPVPIGDPTMAVYFGEVVTSIRQLVKRYMATGSISNMHHEMASPVYEGIANNFQIRLQQPDFPDYWGHNPEGPDIAWIPGVTPPEYQNYSFSLNTWINYFTPAYAGYRGGFRRKFMCYGVPDEGIEGLAGDPHPERHDMGHHYHGGSNMSVCRVSRSNQPNTELDALSSTSDRYLPYFRLFPRVETQLYVTEAARSLAARIRLQFTGDGCAFTQTAQNGALEVELPYYSNLRFYPARRIRNLEPYYQDDPGENTTWFEKTKRRLSGEPGCHVLQHTGGADCHIDMFVSAAEDFCLFMFLSVPVMYQSGGGGLNAMPVPANTLPNSS